MTTRAPAPKDTRPDLQRGDRVIVAEPGIAEWEGEAIALKPGAVSWMVEVRDADMIVRSVAARLVRRVS